MTTEQNPLPEGSEQAADPAAAGTENSAAAQIGALEARLAEMSDAYLRAKAEVENTRRRADEDIAKARKFAIEAFAEALLPVVDSMEAAIANTGAAAAVETLIEGVHATRRQLSSALERNKVLEISPPAGERFDPHRHQAISMVPAEGEANTVVAVLQKGYSINERVMRPALVTVVAPK
ncbi:MAG: nucleotide exchange factor GrpE [Pelomonas sp.]|nr:nucleotide exchange factor GrpE [Roseateles sp.]